MSNPQPEADVVWRVNRPGASPRPPRWVMGGACSDCAINQIITDCVGICAQNNRAL